MGARSVFLALAARGILTGKVAAGPACPGSFTVHGLGNVSLIPTGWAGSHESASVAAKVAVLHGRRIVNRMGGRGYFGSTCTPGAYDSKQYLALDLRGKTLKYTVDLSTAGCGCNAALLLTSMAQNTDMTDCGDYYCDANKDCGVACAEIGIQEANKYSWHSTLHSSDDRWGLGMGYGGGGFGWSGPRNWADGEFGPGGECIDTNRPFEVSVSFPVDDDGALTRMDLKLTQDGRDCPLGLSIGDYPNLSELGAALAKGMTPVVRYWSSSDLLWMDGKGLDKRGPCEEDLPEQCGDAVAFYDFSVTPAFSSSPARAPDILIEDPLPDGTSGSAASNIAVGPFIGGMFAVLAVQAIGVLLVWLVPQLREPLPKLGESCRSASAPLAGLPSSP